MIYYSTKELEEVLVDEAVEEKEDKSFLLVYNDDVNTFDWVIKALIEICKHTSIQAEQLSLIVHFNGKATVKAGPLPELKPMCEGLLDRGLSAVIED